MNSTHISGEGEYRRKEEYDEQQDDVRVLRPETCEHIHNMPESTPYVGLSNNAGAATLQCLDCAAASLVLGGSKTTRDLYLDHLSPNDTKKLFAKVLDFADKRFMTRSPLSSCSGVVAVNAPKH